MSDAGEATPKAGAGERRDQMPALDDRARRHGYKDAVDWLRTLRADGLRNTECARIMGVGTHTLARLAREGGLPRRRVGEFPVKRGIAPSSLLRMDRRGVVEGSHRDVESAVEWLRAHGRSEASADVLRDAGMPDNADEIVYGHRWWRYEPVPCDVKLATLRYRSHMRDVGSEWASSGEFRDFLDRRGLGDTGLRRIDRSRPWGPDNVTVNPQSPDGVRQLLHRRWNAMRRHGGVDPEWEDFDGFLAWGLDHEVDSGTLWTRADTSRPWGPDNAIASAPDRSHHASGSQEIIRSGGGLPDYRFPTVKAAVEWLTDHGHPEAREGSLRLAVTNPSGIRAYGFEWRPSDGARTSGESGSRRPDNPFYARWMQMRHHGGVQSEWDDFNEFERWCRDHDIDPGSNRLRRVDTSHPWGPGNIRTVRRATAGARQSPFYPRWAGMRRNGGIQPEWERFRDFERWCQDHDIEPGDRLYRADTSRPWGPDNIHLIHRDTVGAASSPYYNRWANMRHDGGTQPEWEQFRDFERWCLDHDIKFGDQLRRADDSLPWGPGNILRIHRDTVGATGSPHYARWENIFFAGAIDPAWDDFRTFERWCLEHGIEPGDRLRRIDTSLPWGPGNVEILKHGNPTATDSPLYTRWIGMRHQGGIQPEWDDFKAFERWCREHHVGPDDRLLRADTSLPWGPDNIKGTRRITVDATRSPYYARWRSMRHQGGVRPEWDDFKAFEQWCRDHGIEPGEQLLRVDASRPWGPGNIKGTRREIVSVKSSPYYARWLSMRHKAGVESEWQDFHAFERWCVEHHVRPGDRVSRIDGSRPWSPDNASLSQLKDSPYYARWRSMHGNGGVQSEWDRFRDFERWCREHGVAPGDRLLRVDASRPWGPGNVKGFQRETPGAGKPPNYWRWTNMRKNGGVQPEWDRFRDFECWCQDHDIKHGDQLRRVDTSRPWGPDNIAGIRREMAGTTDSPHYTRWIKMRQNGGVRPEWEQFRDFERWCQERRIEPGDRLLRVDTSRPWGPDNIRDVRREPTHAASSPYYKRWHRMRHKDGIRPEWERFEDFERWCREHGVAPGDRLLRADTSKPWGPGNIEITRKDEPVMGGSPYYVRWRTMRRQGGVDPEWDDFRTFERWCAEHHVAPGDRLQRVDTSRPWGPGNLRSRSPA